MGRGSNKSGPMLDDERKVESQPIERSGAESHVEPGRIKEGMTDPAGEDSASRPAEESSDG